MAQKQKYEFCEEMQGMQAVAITQHSQFKGI